MLEIREISRVFHTAGLTQRALDRVSVSFRPCEFASILGPSGSGKTTFLNIIGGLDQYTSGDLLINGISTKQFRDKDWDSYRNHRIGFVFQSYNLIPHQTILRNVSLALTLSGISKRESLRRAKKALKEVGLERHMMKRPAQLSGGQMQRVAIARALVNDPDILLADEPTGALDSETSLQIMDILKRISEKKLVIMVTHNPELAEQYSTRIITLKDGHITSDTDPYDPSTATEETSSDSTDTRKQKKTHMSLLTSFGLSFNNLMTKKARTILISIAGSIGIIGIALILAVSNGFQRYIDDIEEETMTSYPLALYAETSDITSLLLSMNNITSNDTPESDVRETQLITSLLGSLSKNDLTTFKHYLEEHPDLYSDDIYRITYNYTVDPLIYTRYDGEVKKLNPSDLFTNIYGSSPLSSYSSLASIFSRLPAEDSAELESRYDILAGRLPERYDELLLVLPSDHSISDFLLYSLGFRDPDELTSMVTSIMSGDTIDVSNTPLEMSYADLMDADLRLIHPKDLYTYNPEYNIFENRTDRSDILSGIYDASEQLHIVGVATPDRSSSLSLATTGVFYRDDLIDHIISTASSSDIVQAQLRDETVDVFSGKPFGEKSSSLGLDFKDFITVDQSQLMSAFHFDFDPRIMDTYADIYVDTLERQLQDKLATTLDDAKAALASALDKIFGNFMDSIPDDISEDDIRDYIDEYLDTDFPEITIGELLEEYPLTMDQFKEIIGNYLRALMDHVTDTAAWLDSLARDAAQMLEAKFRSTIKTEIHNMTTYMTTTLMNSFHVDPAAITGAFRLTATEEEITSIVTAMFLDKNTTYQSNLNSLGYQDLDSPTSISIYFTGFDGKTHFLSLLDDYNSTHDEAQQIKYTDTASILTSSVKTIVDAVTYVLIAFVSISLVVSSIMIGVITYISVYERTKEIGILRALGASKSNITSIFNVETFIIGLLSGLIAMTFSLIAIPIINAVLYSLTDVENLQAYLSPANFFALILLSVILTIIGGFIPSRSASKKDPVEALRTE